MLPKLETPIQVWFLSAEAEPFVKIGGLGDVSGVLPRVLNSLESEADSRRAWVQLVLPFHQAIKECQFAIEKIGEFSLPHLPEPYQIIVYRHSEPNLTTYFIDSLPPLFDVPVYSSNLELDGNKYLAFSLAAMHLPSWLDLPVDLFHLNDWHTAFAAYVLKQNQSKGSHPLRKQSILTLHNLPFMGYANAEMLESYGFQPSHSPRLPWWARTLPLPLGLMSTDRIVPVSEGYAQEILTPEMGCGLDPFLITRKNAIQGIVNGIDTDTWNPSTDPLIASRFDSARLEIRSGNKRAIQERLSLPVEDQIPLLVTVSRFDPQKGIDLILDSIPHLAQEKWQLVMLGTGNSSLEAKARELESSFPDKVRAVLRFDNELAHLLYAGGDLFLMPSRYEPCGLSQMIAINYGCLPLAHRTGGLMDTIRDFKESPYPTGFLFSDMTPESFSNEILKALAIHSKKELWQEIQIQGMAEDFSWNRSARKYLQLYNELMWSSSHPKKEAGETA